MTTETARIELDGPGGLFAYPSFVKGVTDPKLGGHLHEILDCWSPERTGDAFQDYLAGRRHFTAAESVTSAHGSSGFLFNVLTAMMRWRDVGDIEAGFIDALALRAVAGSRPAPVDLDDFAGCIAETVRGFEAREWELICHYRGEPGRIASILAQTIIFPQGVEGVVRLWVMASAAFNGALN